MKNETIDQKQTLTLHSRAEWRQWLADHHQQTEQIWLVYFKKHTGKPSLTKVEANLEALCFGWIDSLVMRIDEERYMQKFTPRKKDSVWSEVNKKRVKVLELSGLIQPAGKALIDHARASGEWDKDRSDPPEISMPRLLKKQLQKNKKAEQAWQKCSLSRRKQFLLWIISAKREQTRIRRCKKTIKMLISNLPPNSL